MPFLERDIHQQLLNWKASGRRKPLILRGARQVGKTSILQYFAEHAYKDYIYLNFDEEPELAQLFEENLNPQRILKDLQTHFKKPILPETTLIIFDEIQECSNALNSLKYFCEQSNEYHIASAGSLLGVKLSKGFPVGKVNFLNLAPMSFFEFLKAAGEIELVKLLTDLHEPKAINPIFHNKLIKLLKAYFIVGGMPEAMMAYLQDQDFHAVRIIQKEILDAYTLDFAKHAPKEDLMKIMQVWNLIPSQLSKENKKFIFTAINKSTRAREYESAIQWLVDAGLIIKTYHTSHPKLPLEAYADKNIFKIFALDVGLLGAMSKLAPEIVLEGNKLFEEFKGALTENYVTQELSLQHFDGLYYWTSTGIAEVDFVLSSAHHIFPLEVKAGISTKKRSLLEYGKKYLTDEHHSRYLSRTTLLNFACDGNIINYPLYAIALFPRFEGLG